MIQHYNVARYTPSVAAANQPYACDTLLFACLYARDVMACRRARVNLAGACVHTTCLREFLSADEVVKCAVL